MKRLPDQPRKLKPIFTRLYESDVDELRRRAKRDGAQWQVLLRTLVRDALRADKKIM